MIDIEKFICSLLADHPEGVTVRGDIHRALKEQGLEYKDGKIVPIEDKTELKESEDEKVRKEIIAIFKGQTSFTTEEDGKKYIEWLEKQGDKDKLIQELGEYKVKYTQEVLEQHINSMGNKDDERLRKTTIAFLKDFVEQGYENAVECIDWLEKQGNTAEINPDEIIEECHQDNADHIIDIVTEQGKPSEWNEVDENEYNHILKLLNLVAEEQETKGYNNLISSVNWLKSIKDRIQSKQSSKPQGKSATEAIKEEKVDKVEPKFKAGDWLQYRNAKPFYVEGITSQGYVNGISCLPFSWEDEIHLWSIADAQAGDVLVASDGSIFIFAGVVDCACKYYITLTATNDVKINKEEKGGYWETSSAVYPATNEQRDTLMKAITDTGYEFDFEKKELKAL